MWSYQSYDEGRIDSGRTSSGRNTAFNLNFKYTCTSMYKKICHAYVTSKLLLHPVPSSFIGTMYWTKFLYELEKWFPLWGERAHSLKLFCMCDKRFEISTTK